MTTPFGPQLIGETEKSLNALLRTFLEGTGLTEPQWVTLRLADMLDGTVDTAGLVATVGHRAHFTHSAQLVGELTERGLLHDGRLTSAGRGLLTAVQGTITTQSAPIWNDLSPDDVAAATRVLNEVISRAHRVLG
jgi:hypothetical protein